VLAMKMLQASDLPKLPAEVKSLVADGVYSLYEVASDAKYLLYTQQRQAHYFLSDDGSIVRSGQGSVTPPIDIMRAVSFVDADAGVRLNYRAAV
jgi:hypothetical protein